MTQNTGAPQDQPGSTGNVTSPPTQHLLQLDGSDDLQPAPMPGQAPRQPGRPSATTASPSGVPTRPRPKGPNASAVVLGLVCIVLGTLAIARQVWDFSVDWGWFGPSAVIIAGALLLVFGLLGLARSRRE